MDDVESVNVLKGPAATALYGSRGGDGAIIIKTKGLKGQRMAINLSHTLAFEKVYLHGDYQNEYEVEIWELRQRCILLSIIRRNIRLI